MAKDKYLKLGEKAASFADTQSGLLLAGRQVVVATDRQLKSPKTAKALLGGHLVIADQEEYDDWVKIEDDSRVGPQVLREEEVNRLKAEIVELKTKLEKLTPVPETSQSKFDAMNVKKLLSYYQTEYEVNEDMVAEFEAKTVEEKREFLKSLEVEN